ncbi:MAG TPA: L,D-transpeptidase [Clostridia bacterium]|nr:L,D-transpeptidase [Clostridia bacterium]
MKRLLLVILCFAQVLGLSLWGLYPGHVAAWLHRRPETAYPAESLPVILKSKGLPGRLSQALLYVDKSDLTLTLYEGNIPLKTYRVAMGPNYLAGAKLREGDKRTPEGRYFISEKRIVFPADPLLGSRWLGISYPLAKDVARGYAEGIITGEEYRELMEMAGAGKLLPQKTPLGGEIGIHGGHREEKEATWTLGCIALTNRDVEELYPYIAVGTPIIIVP